MVNDINPITPDVSQKLSNMSFILACLVVSLHIPEVSSNASTIWIQRVFRLGVSRIAVPFFGGISGYFLAGKLNGDYYKMEVWKRVKSLMIPLGIWGAIYVIVKLTITWYDSKTLDQIHDSLLLGYSPFSFFILWSGLNPTRALSTLWFLRSLFVVICLMPCISYLVYKYRWRWLLFSWCIYSGTKISSTWERKY